MCTLRHALWFKNAGYPVSAVGLKGSPLEEAFEEQAIPFLALTETGYFSLKDSLALRRFLKAQNTSTLFCHHLKDLWRLRVALIGMPRIQVIGFARMFLKNVNKKDFLHTWVYSRMETLVSLTDVQKLSLLKCLPVKSSNIKIIPDSVDTEEFHPGKRNETFRTQVFGLQPGEKAVGLVGRIDPQKGSREFIESAHALSEKHSQLKFFLIGKETPDTPGFEQKLKDYVSKNNLESRVIFLGHRKDVADVIANLDLFVMPSYEETFGDVLIEAMSCQVPSIATAAGGPLNIIDNGINGLLVPPKDVFKLTEAIDRILSDSVLAQKLAVEGRKKALKVYEEEKVFSEIKGLMRA